MKKTTIEILELIRKVLDKLNHYIKYSEVRLDETEKELIKQAYLALLPDRGFSYSNACGGCIKEAIRVLHSFYMRENKQVETEKETVEVEIEALEEVKEVSEVVELEVKKEPVKRSKKVVK